MKTVNLAYLADPRFGGWVSYTAHLSAALGEQGYAVRLVKIGNRFETKARPFGYGLQYQNFDIGSALALLAAEPLFITAIGPKYAAVAAELLRAGAACCIHDPTELRDDLLRALSLSKRPIVAIRRLNETRLKDAGLRSVFIPHPYVRQVRVPPTTREWHAVAFSRLDWDKRTNIIAEANTKLPAARAVRIYGSENTMFTHHKVGTVDVDWKRNYHGRFPAEIDAAPRLAANAKFVVDMSTIAGDGDGTQYTFLEAWDAGAALVVHEKWIVTGADSVRPGQTAFVAGDADSLVRVLSEKRRLGGVCEGGARELEKHSAQAVVPAYLEVLAA